MRFPALVIVLVAGVCAVAPGAQQPNTSTRTVAAVTGRIDRIDTVTRSLILRVGENQFQSVFVGPEVKVFNDLKAGDNVSIRV